MESGISIEAGGCNHTAAELVILPKGLRKRRASFLDELHQEQLSRRSECSSRNVRTKELDQVARGCVVDHFKSKQQYFKLDAVFNG